MKKRVFDVMPRHFRLMTGLFLLAVTAAGLPGVALADGDVVSFHGKVATADEIVKELAGDGGAASALPEGMIPDGMIGAATTRGITFTGAAPAKVAVPAEQATAAVASSSGAAAGAGVQSAAGCAGTGNAIALDINFAFNSDNLGRDAYQALEELAQAMMSDRLADCRFLLEGHTDGTGAADYNLSLSERRALAVREFLAAQGIAPARLRAVGKGDAQLLNPQDPAAAENRRVQVSLDS